MTISQRLTTTPSMGAATRVFASVQKVISEVVHERTLSRTDPQSRHWIEAIRDALFRVLKPRHAIGIDDYRPATIAAMATMYTALGRNDSDTIIDLSERPDLLDINHVDMARNLRDPLRYALRTDQSVKMQFTHALKHSEGWLMGVPASSVTSIGMRDAVLTLAGGVDTRRPKCDDVSHDTRERRKDPHVFLRWHGGHQCMYMKNIDAQERAAMGLSLAVRSASLGTTIDSMVFRHTPRQRNELYRCLAVCSAYELSNRDMRSITAGMGTGWRAIGLAWPDLHSDYFTAHPEALDAFCAAAYHAAQKLP